jgi:molybdopterin-guanine dinucleotide biosynthesis protein A
MLAAGAAKVFWVRALKTHLKEGITALFEIIGNDGIMICESNSLRSIVEPGLFFMVTNGKASGGKPSAEEVVGYADKIILFDDSQSGCGGLRPDEFDIDMNKIKLVGGRWSLKMDATAIIMAGGKSRRMGADKSMLPVKGKPLIEYVLEQLSPHFSQILISSNDVPKYAFLGVEIIPDEVAGKGMLVGIASALRASANQTNFVIACDIPEINISSVRRMLRESEGFDAVVPQIGPTRYEPLFAVYKKSALSAIDNAITSGNYRIIDSLKKCRVKYIDLSYIDYIDKIKNLNTMDDYLEFIGKKENAAV